MSKELFVRAEEVAGALGISKPYAYKLVREMRRKDFDAFFLCRYKNRRSIKKHIKRECYNTLYFCYFRIYYVDPLTAA